MRHGDSDPSLRTMESTDFRLEHPGEAGRVVRGRVTRPVFDDGHNAAVIVVHGFKGFFNWGFFPALQRAIAAQGFACIAINLSGSGVGDDLETFSDDEAFFRSTPSRDLEDLERLRTAVEAGEHDALGGIDANRLALFGHSRGGGSVLLHAEQRGDYRAVVTWASVARSSRFTDDQVHAWRAAGVLEVPNARTGQVHRMSVDFLDDVERNADALDVLAACQRSRTPTLLVHGEQDESVPFEEGLEIFEAFTPGRADLVAIEGAGHTFGAVHPYAGITPALEQAMKRTVDFLTKHLRDEHGRG